MPAVRGTSLAARPPSSRLPHADSNDEEIEC
jgi:hypothetical protein